MDIMMFTAKCVAKFGPEAEEYIDPDMAEYGVLRFGDGFEYALGYKGKIMFGVQNVENKGDTNEYCFAELHDEDGNVQARLENDEKHGTVLYLPKIDKELSYPTWEEGEAAMAKALMG
jgi:hypothetical protein